MEQSESRIVTAGKGASSVHRRVRRLLTWLALAVCGVLLFLLMPRLVTPKMLRTDDFVEYWAAGRLNLAGANPYLPDALLPLQQQAGRYEGVPVMMWNPPFVLPLVMPLAVLPYPLSRALWLLLNIVIVFFCVECLWRFYGGPRRLRWLAWALGFAFVPTFNTLQSGQIPAMMLLGLTGFLCCEKRGRLLLAGGFAALTAVKPHTLYLFWIAMLLWSIERRRWAVLSGAAIALCGGVLMAWATNRALVSQYLHAAASFPPLDWATPTLGGFLRLVFGPEHAWLQFFPVAVGVPWAVWYWARLRERWQWARHLPVVTVVSMVTAVYGWSYDWIVCLLPLLQVTAWLVNGSSTRVGVAAAGSYLAISALSVALHGRVNDFFFFWMPPLLLAWYAVWRRAVMRRAALECRPALIVTDRGPGS